MLITGDAIDARTAGEWGLVNHVVPAASSVWVNAGAAAAAFKKSRRRVFMAEFPLYRRSGHGLHGSVFRLCRRAKPGRGKPAAYVGRPPSAAAGPPAG